MAEFIPAPPDALVPSDCPTPHRAPYPTLTEALQAGAELAHSGATVRVDDTCVCGCLHLLIRKVTHDDTRANTRGRQGAARRGKRPAARRRRTR